jgi:hypothetical protein
MSTVEENLKDLNAEYADITEDCDLEEDIA